MSSAAARTVPEELRDGDVPLWTHPEWEERFPWLVQGTTGAGPAAAPFDLGLFGAQPVGAVLERWRRLRAAAGLPTAVHSRQVHAAEIARHPREYPAGTLLLEGFDGHLARGPGLLLTVSVADCVPVSVVDARRRALALVHAGWRGTAAGIVERAIHALHETFGSRPADLWVHCGPAICGECYEVGPEVHRAIHPGRPAPAAPAPIDVRAAIGERVRSLGVLEAHLSRSGHCTRCGPGSFFSHRAGSAARQMGVLGRRE